MTRRGTGGVDPAPPGGGLQDDERPRPPVDLRLLGAAAGVWSGSLAAVLVRGTSLLAAGLVTLVVLATCLRARRRTGGTAAEAVGRRRVVVRVLTVLAACALAAGLAAAARLAAEAADPMTRAGVDGRWVSAVVQVSGWPERRAAFATEGEEASPTGGSEVRWLVPARAAEVTVDGRRWSSHASVELSGSAPRLGDVQPGERLRVSGTVTVETWAGLDGLVLRSRSAPVVLGDAPVWSSIAGTVRAGVVDQAAALSPDARGLLPGLVVGDTAGIDEALLQDARVTGLAHLLAVSGSHFTLVGGAVLLLLRPVGLRVAAVGAGTVMAAMVVVVGPEPSVVRAFAMGLVTLLALLSGRERAGVPALLAAVTVLLLLEPRFAVSVAFSLSVAATAALVLLVPPWTHALQRRGWPPGWAALVVVPVAAQLATMPLIAGIGGGVSLVGVLANLLVAPVTAVALLAGVGCAVTAPWWPDAASVFATACAPLLEWTAWVARTLARWPLAHLPWPATPAGIVLLVGSTGVGLLVLRARRVRALVAATGLGAVVVLLPAQWMSPGWPLPSWRVALCEVGQGDAILLRTEAPDAAVVVDTGPDPHLMDACLDRFGITVVPLVVLTHLHADHVDGLPGVLDGRTVGAVGVGPGREPAGAWQAVLHDADAAGVPVVPLPTGTRWWTGGVVLEVLGPRGSWGGSEGAVNNESVVLTATVDGLRVLLTGDIEREAQQALLDAGVDLTADVLKAPHHGSGNLLPTFVRAVAAPVVLIGVGRDNDYGHPDPDMLAAVHRAGARAVLRTDLDGDVAVGLRGGSLVTAVRGATARTP
ncbi:ComEC/Rec2 family competence protein [Nakamurella leprariae]|uniref:ComEC/Rec2 family competence protein n=1 Tax=Nakamurella leprariae TaxID=2803911 RepID=A0A939C1P5_9ACTN|nr:ComEC/Rec2 family competence protein [Nakamurella leprariae]MBM9467352.1 ComEC/Rec2 family competence protein [Nakamurella leprariae]